MTNMFEDMEESFGIPRGSTKMTPARIRSVETAIVQRTADIEDQVSKLDTIDLMGDASLELKERVLRGKEYLRRESINTYEMTKDAVEMLKSELMPGASASMWLAYGTLVRALNECHGKIDGIYSRLDDDLRLIEVPEELQVDEDEKTFVTDVDTLMAAIAKAKEDKNSIDVTDAVQINLED